jgi:hypothetical protein
VFFVAVPVQAIQFLLVVNERSQFVTEAVIRITPNAVHLVLIERNVHRFL